jgi:putative ABC transport system substrate-binding protein
VKMRGRRYFLQGSLALADLGILSGCGMLPPQARAPAQAPRIGYLVGGPPSPSTQANLEAFRQGLKELGYVEGQNVTVEPRYAEDRTRVSEIVDELVREKVDFIVTGGTPEVLAAKQATKSIPIVFAAIGDPVGAGVVESLARAGGNATGTTNLGSRLYGKRLELLKAAFPETSRVAVLWNGGNQSNVAISATEIEPSARALGLHLVSLDVRRAEDFDGAFQAAARERVDALINVGDAIIVGNQARIVEFATRSQLPAIYDRRAFVDGGGLMAYGPNTAEMWRRAATYVDKILKGANPADLPVEQPTKFDFVINLKTAQALGLTIPQSVLAQATEIVQ